MTFKNSLLSRDTSHHRGIGLKKQQKIKFFLPLEQGNVLLIDKSAGITSAGVLRRLQPLLPGVKIGHGGTLDPFATGLLTVLLGKATRLSQYLLGGCKEYTGVIHFGWATDTHDLEGTPLAPPAPADLPLTLLESLAGAFRGRITQRLPSYSSIKWQGKPLYEYARQGQPAPAMERETVVHLFEITGWQTPLLMFRTVCEGGTYIRAIAHQLGEMAGCGAHLRELRRLRSGRLDLSGACRLEDLEAEPASVSGFLRPPGIVVEEFPALSCPAGQITRLRHGNHLRLAAGSLPAATKLVRLTDETDGNLLALAEIVLQEGEELTVHPTLVLI